MTPHTPQERCPLNLSVVVIFSLVVPSYSAAQIPRFAYVVNENTVVVLNTAESPTITPTPIPPLCIGDCNADGRVTVDELIAGINMALGDTPPSACSAFCLTGCHPGPAFKPPTVVCLTRAVRDSLDGCSTRCVTDEDCDPANKCSSYQCTVTGCQYRCRCH